MLSEGQTVIATVHEPTEQDVDGSPAAGSLRVSLSPSASAAATEESAKSAAAGSELPSLAGSFYEERWRLARVMAETKARSVALAGVRIGSVISLSVTKVSHPTDSLPP